ncbi:NADH:flavin oxidoreductase/NADH oxidase [Amycolatopsis anabasis]|uniref:oxidoreductase n=1 Tax=Amycolatopsis anabasis TaxID=1840409 RepID=UPI0015D38F2C|nr:NADH:flavin oxidoreductase/NADH oxidase [Amycolatopsis anabasis]
MAITSAAPDRPADAKTTPWTSIRLRELTLPNRVWLSPMCQYSADEYGAPTEWHLAHYGARAAGGVGMVMVECTAVAPDMRTTARDLGLWSEHQVGAHRRLAGLISSVGSVPAVQLGIAGRKSSHGVPWDNTGTRHPVAPAAGGWQPLAPSPLPFSGLATPRSMTADDIDRVLGDLERAARNAHRAGYQALGLQASNGYLFHQFLSPLANQRTDAWGGDLEGRLRFPLAVVSALRAGWPAEKPLLIRAPVSDLLDGGVTADDAEILVARMAQLGVDLLDINSGALVPEAPRPTEPLENARFAHRFRRLGVPTATSGSVTEAHQLHRAIPESVDALFIGRAMLRDPYWALRARGGRPTEVWPKQYHRAF